MASPAVIGALRVVLGADTAALDKGLRDAQSRLESFGSSVGKAGAVAAAAFVAAGAAIGIAVKGAIDQADNLGKMAQKIGVPVEELSALKLAAELSDVSLEQLGKGLGKLSKAMVETAAKPTSEVANAFRALGVSVVDSDGRLKSSSQVMTDVAGKFEGLKDGAGKTAVSMALFGKAGADLIPLLNTGKTGLTEMAKEAAELGVVISTHTAKAAEEFNDNLKRLGTVKDGIILKITAGMLPALQNLSANMVSAAKEGDQLRITGEALGNMMTGLFSIVQHVSLGWQRLGVEWQALREFMSTDIFSGKVAENWNKFREAGVESTRQFEVLRSTMESAHLGDAFGDIGNKAAAAAKPLKEFNFAAMGGKNALDQFLESQAKSLASQQAELATIGLAAGAKERLKIVLQGLAIAQAASIPLTDALRMKLSETAFAAEQMALKIAGATLVQQNLEPLLLYRQELANTEAAMISVGATAEQIGRAQEQVALKFGMSWQSVGASIAGTAGALSQLTGTFSKENKAMGIASKAFGIGQAIINTQIAITKALATLPPPASYFAASFAAAQGAAAVAAIAAQGFATGGSFRVGGGQGGGDSKMMQFMAEPGEMVDIRKPGQGRDSNGNGGTFVIESVPDDHWVSGKQLKRFVEAFNSQSGELILKMA